MGRRIKLEIAVRRARAQIWMRSGSREPIYALPGRLDDMYGRFIATDARPTLERLGEVLVPSGRMSELFAASGGDAESRKLLEDELINGGGHMLGDRWDFDDILRWAGRELACRPVVHLHLRWRPVGEGGGRRRRAPGATRDEFWINPLEERGLTKLPDGSWRVEPELARGWFQPEHTPDPYLAGARAILAIRLPAISGLPPGPVAFLEYLDEAVAREQTLAVGHAAAHPEDSSWRVQIARVRWSMGTDQMRIARARTVDRLGGSLLEDESYGLNPPLTQHFLALQHRAAMLQVADLRDHLLVVVGHWLANAILDHFEMARGPQIVPLGAPTAASIEAAYEEFKGGKINLNTYLRRTRWETSREHELYEAIAQSGSPTDAVDAAEPHSTDVAGPPRADDEMASSRDSGSGDGA